MGILNVTPDSFSDGGMFAALDSAIAQAETMVAEGADIIDIGGESTRPGRDEMVSADEELSRVLPVVQELKRRLPAVLLSIDTYKGAVAQQCLDAGADVINDIYALRRSPDIATHVGAHGAGLILMHMLGEPHSMQQDPQYRHVLVDVKDFLKERLNVAVEAGVTQQNIAVDPGIGFGKTLEHNLKLIGGLEYLRLLQRPICVGVSRKGFLGKLTGDAPVTDREEATLAATTAAVMNGAAIVRVHNVKAVRRALSIINALKQHS